MRNGFFFFPEYVTELDLTNYTKADHYPTCRNNTKKKLESKIRNQTTPEQSNYSDIPLPN